MLFFYTVKCQTSYVSVVPQFTVTPEFLSCEGLVIAEGKIPSSDTEDQDTEQSAE
jgi:hypothetical protein